MTMRCVVAVSTRIAVFLADVLVLLVTWSKTAHLYREARRLDVKAPLATLLFRDGQFTLLYQRYFLLTTGLYIR